MDYLGEADEGPARDPSTSPAITVKNITVGLWLKSAPISAVAVQIGNNRAQWPSRRRLAFVIAVCLYWHVHVCRAA